MKVVINACFGGFGLSDAAIRLYADKKGITLYAEGGKYGTVQYWTKPADQRPKPLAEPWHTNSLEARMAHNKASSESSLYDRDIERADPALVATVEQLGSEAASGRCAELRVVEIPDGVDWEIDEYDGNEHIAEKHQTWR
jgi:hypothetical protein